MLFIGKIEFLMRWKSFRTYGVYSLAIDNKIALFLTHILLFSSNFYHVVTLWWLKNEKFTEHFSIIFEGSPWPFEDLTIWNGKIVFFWGVVWVEQLYILNEFRVFRHIETQNCFLLLWTNPPVCNKRVLPFRGTYKISPL